MDDYVFPCEELKYVIGALTRECPDVGTAYRVDFEDDDFYKRMHAVERHVGQVYGMVGASTSDWRGLKVLRRVNDAARLVWVHEDRTLFFGADCWKGPVFRAAVRANANPEWAEGFGPAIDAAVALGGRKAALDFLLAEFPPLETPGDRRRRYEEEREQQEHLLFEAAFAQEDAV